jgi:glycosyltransferase involved in cell wall biosynthesis
MNQEGICITMPIFNESEGILDFVHEISIAFDKINYKIIIINDGSTDNTTDELAKINEMGLNVESFTNSQNIGHGPSTLIGLKTSVYQDLPYIISVDGDGQISGGDLLNIYHLHTQNNVDVIEGIRFNRKDPKYRFVISKLTAILIFISTRILPKDANTPIRSYKKESLKTILEKINDDNPIPNMYISKISRKEKFKIIEFPINSRHRRGTNPVGSSWVNKYRLLPSLKLVIFCIRAAKFWIKNNS